MLNSMELTGRTRSHLAELTDPRCTIHNEVVGPFLKLHAAAAKEGINLVPASSFRDFERQKLIWNNKYNGERAVYDGAGLKVDILKLSLEERVELMLIWSALPGASRHHWGTDLDIFDRAAVSIDYEPKLLASEYAIGGPFSKLDKWLDRNLKKFGFFRPYGKASSRIHDKELQIKNNWVGVNPEPWHISYSPIAQACLPLLTPKLLSDLIKTNEIQGSVYILKNIEDIHTKFVMSINAP